MQGAEMWNAVIATDIITIVIIINIIINVIRGSIGCNHEPSAE